MKTFSERVVEAVLSVPKGRVTTYGRIARAAGGGAMSSQSVTSILAKAFDAGNRAIPFHRIVYADGSIWVDPKCWKERMAMYKKEGIEITKGKVRDFERVVFEFE